MKYILVLLCVAFISAVPINSGITLQDNGPCTPTTGPGICSDNGTLTWYDSSLNKTPFSVMVGPQGPQGPAGVIVGTTLTGTLTCPKGTGTIGVGFTSKSCTFNVTGLQ